MGQLQKLPRSNLAKVGVEGSNPFARSRFNRIYNLRPRVLMRPSVPRATLRVVPLSH